MERVKYEEEGLWLLNQMKDMVEKVGLLDSDIDLIDEKIEELKNPELTIGARLLKEYQKENDMAKVGMKLAKMYKEDALREYYSLSAYSNMELSTQAVIEDAIKNGIKVTVIDENDQFIRLESNEHVEYVKNGNMTSKDSYISPLIMENKVVTKKVLAEKGFRVPKGYEVSSLEEALQKFNYIKDKPIVIKPKSTNFGLGITIFKKGTSSVENYSKAIEFALKEDKDILIEEFIEGTEYRFFVIEGETEAVLLRVPANVVGDGKHTIRELELAVEIANAMMAKVCGVDLIISDIKEEVSATNYGVIEANFNPMMMMHIYPHSGKSRRLSLNVLKMLFPEKNIK